MEHVGAVMKAEVGTGSGACRSCDEGRGRTGSEHVRSCDKARVETMEWRHVGAVM